MKFRKSMLSASIAAALLFAATAQASGAPQQDQTTTSNQQTQTSVNGTQAGTHENPQQLGTIQVVGIRASLQKSLQTKRNANAIVDAITSEDLGKFPNTNAAEALSLLPGVQVDRQFGQGQRITIDGIDSTLNLTLLDGYPVSQTSWRYFSQPQRGFNYLMISPEILGRAEIFKSQQARLPAGSIGGTVIMHTRRPLDMKANTFSGSVGVNYNDQAGKSKPTASVLYSWKNQASTFGFDIALQHYEEKIDRQGLEVFGYSPVSAFVAAGNTKVAAQVASGGLLAGDQVPQEVNSAWFQQGLKRDSALANIQFHPNQHLRGDLSLLYIKERFTNYNQSVYGFLTQSPAAENQVDSFIRGPNGVVTGGHVTPVPGNGTDIFYDNQVRPSNIKTKGVNLELGYYADGWSISGQAGTNKADNPNNGQYFIEPVYNGPFSWSLKDGIVPDDLADYQNPAKWALAGGGSLNVFGSSQKDNYGKVDFKKYFDGAINTVAFGVRYFDSKTAFLGFQYTTSPSTDTLSQIGTVGITNILGNFAGVGAGSAHHPIVGEDNVTNWVNSNPTFTRSSAGPLGSSPGFVSQYTWNFDQKTTAAYAQADFATGALRGNFGLRFVHTKNDGAGYNVPTGTVLTFSNLQSFWVHKTGTDNKLLPSFTVIYDDGGDVVLRGSMAKVMAWAPYNTMAYQVALNDTTLTGTVGNPGLGPYTAYNTDVSAEWYFAPQSVLAVSAFYKNITSYIVQKKVVSRQLNLISQNDPTQYKNTLLGTNGCDATGYCDYNVNKFVSGASAKVKGLTVSYQQAFKSGFGLIANVTYADGETSLGTDMAFLSRWSASISPYYEKGPFSARVNLNMRTHYSGLGYVAGAANPATKEFTTISASLGWQFNKVWSVTLDGSNLTNTKYEQYLPGGVGSEWVLNRYTTGRRFTAMVHFKF